MTRSPRFLYAGTYEREYPRNQQLIRLLRRIGADVIEIHEPFWERFRDKSVGFGGITATIALALRLILIYLKLIFRVVTRLRSKDAVVIGYIGQLDMLVIGAIARLFGIPVLFNPLVTLTDTIIEDRALVEGQTLFSKLIWIGDWLSLRLASLTLTDTAENADYLVERFGVTRSRIKVLHVGADDRVFRPHDSHASSSAGLHVLFYGKMIPLHGIETILSAIGILHEAGDTDISFEIIGTGQQAQLVQDFLESNPAASVVHREWAAYQRLPARIASADCVLGIFGNGAKAGRVIPNKVFQAMAVGAPIITRDSCAVRRALVHEESALLIRPDDPECLASSIRRMRDPELRNRLSAGSRDAFERHGSDTALASIAFEVVNELVEPVKRADHTGWHS